MKKEIKYITIHTSDGDLFGGNQNLFSQNIVSKFGCGLIAAADVSLSLTPGKEEMTLEQYEEYVRKIRKYFLIFPKMGMNGWGLSVGLNLVFLKYKMPYRAHWKMFPVTARSQRNFERMLRQGIPVILSAGPNFPNIFGKEKVTLYSKITKGNYRKTGSMHKHFVTVTAIDPQGMMKISSWGKCFYISMDEWLLYARKISMPLLSNYLSIRHI